jgi:probable rRNA maturation factor
MEILITNRQRRHRISRQAITRTARVVLVALRHPDAELSILLVDDPQIAAMNRTFLQREGPTNVIAFPMREGAFGELNSRLLGDVVISVDTAWRESLAARLGFEYRLQALLVHGILHLCGFNHEQDPREARRMAAMSRRLMKKLEAEKQLQAQS